MKKIFLSIRLSVLITIGLLMMLSIGLQLSQGSIAVSQARSQTTIQSVITSTLPNVIPSDFGFGEYDPPIVPDLTDQQRQATQIEIDQNIKRFGLRQPDKPSPYSTSLAWPLRAANGLSDYGFHAIGAFVDHDSANPNHVQDYMCGPRTYDITGYNHQGTDISLWPFSWNKMDNNEVEIVAAASGTIVAKYDGNFDRSCSMNNNQWNGVVIQHADGSTAWYVHMKKNSVTAKNVSDTVTTGEYLGVVGSSGSSTGPHLHLEIQNAAHTVIDPYAGMCNNIASAWTAQRPYYDSAVNAVTTGDAAPVFQACPSQTLTHVKDQFNRGDKIYFTIYYRDILSTTQSVYTIYQPNGSVYNSWSYSPAKFYSTLYTYWSVTLPSNATVPFGLWKFEVTFAGKIYTHYFFVGYQVNLHGQPADQTLYLNWDVPSGVPITSTWQIAYTGITGAQASPITGLVSSTRAFTLTGLSNYTWYTITLDAKVNTTSIVTDTVQLMPTGLLVYLPLVLK